MNSSIYQRLSKNGIKKNRQIYTPFIIASIVTFTLFFIISAMASTKKYAELGFRGMKETQMTLGLAVFIVALFSIIFIFYTHSFLVKRRQKELALYQVLGMEKQHLRKIMLWEHISLYIKSMVGALIMGTLLFKVSEVILTKLAKAKINSVYLPEIFPYIATLILGFLIFSLIFIRSMFSIQFIQPIKYLREAQAGEKEPKVNWILAVIGIICIGIGYYLSLTVDTFFDMMRFMIAVAFVIVGTLSGFIALSVAVLKVLQRNKKFYYKKKNFTNVSGLMHRMKKNGAGLANIAIIATSVIILLSSAVTIYIGSNKLIKDFLPRDIMVYSKPDETKEMMANVSKFMEEKGIEMKDQMQVRNIGMALKFKNGEFEYNYNRFDTDPEIFYLILMPAKDFKFMVEDVNIGPKEAYIYGPKNRIGSQEIEIGNIKWQGVFQSEEIPAPLMELGRTNLDRVLLVYGDDYSFEDVQENTTKMSNKVNYESKIGFNVDLSAKEEIKLKEELKEYIRKEKDVVYGVESFQETSELYYAFNGGIVFCGFFLGVVFMVALALIIYYKQLTEGYEDLHRFTIMRRVGMTKREIKSTIKSQILAVFMLPIVVAAIHVAFAYPMVKSILSAMYIETATLYLKVAIGTVAVFILIYIIIYALTSRSYYKIVTSTEEWY
ncbi:MAG: hypothetical protein Q4P29_03250 [Tissierellia bacterium]|nr:hypothetical protein [Tissierellia bacterium]